MAGFWCRRSFKPRGVSSRPSSSLRPWFLLPGVAALFMVKHVLRGWCPPVPVLRRLGFRTAGEIARERYALKALRGDFQGINREDFRKAFEAAKVAA